MYLKPQIIYTNQKKIALQIKKCSKQITELHSRRDKFVFNFITSTKSCIYFAVGDQKYSPHSERELYPHININNWQVRIHNIFYMWRVKSFVSCELSKNVYKQIVCGVWVEFFWLTIHITLTARLSTFLGGPTHLPSYCVFSDRELRPETPQLRNMYLQSVVFSASDGGGMWPPRRIEFLFVVMLMCHICCGKYLLFVKL